MIEVPVTVGFESTQVIGRLTIDETSLPPKPDFVFAIGYRLGGESFKLFEISLVSDTRYQQYLEQEKELAK